MLAEQGERRVVMYNNQMHLIALCIGFFPLLSFAPTTSASEMRWFDTEGVNVGESLGSGDYATIYTISGPGIPPNSVVKLYKWDVDSQHPVSENMRDEKLLEFLNGFERTQEALGEMAIRAHGVINWKGTKGIILERLPIDSERRDWVNDRIYSRHANQRTVDEFQAAMSLLIEKRLLHPDVHIAILSNGSIKLYDNDLVVPWNRGGENAARSRMEKIRAEGSKYVSLAVQTKTDPDCRTSFRVLND